MEPLSISALLFSLVALEVSATIKKSTEEGRFAFLSPRIRSSKPQVLSAKLEELLKIKDNRTIQTVLSEAGVINAVEKNLDQLEKLELSIDRVLGDHYDRILHFLTEDLKDFFKAYKILWDVENLKMVLCSLLDEHPAQREVAIKGPSKHLDSVAPLLETHDFEEALKNGMKLLPVDFSSRIKIEEDQTIQDLLFSLDLAVFEYLQKKSGEIGTRRTQLTWEIVAGVYEIENIITMGRLKYFDILPERIREFLFPVQKHLEGSEVKRLSEAGDYSDFLHVLRGTAYKEFIPRGEVNPSRLESLLKNQKRNLNTEEMLQEEEVETVANFLIKLGDHYDIIREASFFLLLEEGGKKQT